MLGQFRLLAGRLLVLAIYLALAFVGVVLLVWGFFFALAVAGALLVLFLLMRLFGVRRPVIRSGRAGVPPQGAPSGPAASREQKPDVIELQRRDDGSYE